MLKPQVQFIYSNNLGINTKPFCQCLPLKQLCLSYETYFCISSSGQIFTLANQQLSQLSFPITVHKICSNNSTVLFVAEIGLYFQGVDIKSKSFSNSIQLIKGFSQVRLTDVAIGLNHASAVDHLGNFYVWGSAYNDSEAVQSNKILNCKKVCCGDFITCLTTTGGYFYVIGNFNTLDKNLTPSSICEIERYIIVDFCVGNRFCALVDENGFVFVFDEGDEIVVLGSVKDFLEIHSFNKGVFVFTEGFVYKWYGLRIKEWELEIFSACGGCWVLGGVNGMLAVQGVINWELKNENKADSFGKMRSSISKITKKTYTQHFYQDHIYNNLLKYRKQYKIAESTLKVFTPISLLKLTSAWIRIKSYNNHQILLQRTKCLSELLLWVLKVSHKLTFLNLNFAFMSIEEIIKAQIEKEKESFDVRKNHLRIEGEKLLECLKRLWAKEKARHGEVLVSVFKFLVKGKKKKLKGLKRFLRYFSGIEKKKVLRRFYEWVKVFKILGRVEKGFLRFRKTCLWKFGKVTFRLVKSFHLYRSLKLNSLKRAVFLLKKQVYVRSTIWYFSKWVKIRLKYAIILEKPEKLYLSLAKSIFFVIHKNYKSLLKFTFSHISSNFLYSKLINQYKNPLLYFSTVIYKITTRLKFSTFKTVSRFREKNNFTLNLDFSDRISSFCFVLEKICDENVRFMFSILEQLLNTRKKRKNNTLADIPEQTITFNNQVAEYENPFLLSSIPNTQENAPTNRLNPPISSKPSKTNTSLPPKPPIRTGSFSESFPKEDPSSRRKNYDNHLRKKLKNFEKFNKKTLESKNAEKILAKKTPKKKCSEVQKIDKNTSKHSENFFKLSLAVLGLRKFLEKKEFITVLGTFKILKSCFKELKNPYSQCFWYYPDKYSVFN